MKILSLILLTTSLSVPVLADSHISNDIRYCFNEPLRTSDGRIARNSSEVAKFKRIHVCPVTLKSTGSCKGWEVDHVIPLAVGGCDKVFNMQWLPSSIKSCAVSNCKDRFERTIYLRKGQ